MLKARSQCFRTGSTQRYQLSRRLTTQSGLAGKTGQPYFSPHTNRGERFLGPNLDLCCRRWHPAKKSGVLRIASSVLHILPQTNIAPDSGALEALVIGRKAAQERFSEESFRHLQTRNVFLKSSTASSRTLQPELTAHSKPGLTRGTF